MNDQDLIDIVKDVTNALAAIKDALLELEARIRILERINVITNRMQS